MKPNENLMVDLSALTGKNIKYTDWAEITSWIGDMRPRMDVSLALNKCYKLTRVKNTVKVELIEEAKK